MSLEVALSVAIALPVSRGETWARRLIGDDISMPQAVVIGESADAPTSPMALIADADGVALHRSPRSVEHVSWTDVRVIRVVRGASGFSNGIEIAAVGGSWATLLTPVSPHGGEYSAAETRRLVASLEGRRPPPAAQ